MYDDIINGIAPYGSGSGYYHPAAPAPPVIPLPTIVNGNPPLPIVINNQPPPLPPGPTLPVVVNGPIVDNSPSQPLPIYGHPAAPAQPVPGPGSGSGSGSGSGYYHPAAPAAPVGSGSMVSPFDSNDTDYYHEGPYYT